MIQSNCKRLQKSPHVYPLDSELNDSFYSALKQDLISIDVTIESPAENNYRLCKVFYFRLTDNSIAWLKQVKTGKSFKTLADLGLYKDDEILFSSCTLLGSYKNYLK